jgi:hypothetical protein
LQFGQRAGLSPAETRAEIAQPAKQIVGALFVDDFFVDRLDRFALGELLSFARGPNGAEAYERVLLIAYFL